jgi:Flp pilus assembly protein TadB
MVIAGYSMYGLPGAIAGALVAYFIGRQSQEDAQRRRDRAIRDAEELHSEAKASAQRNFNRPRMFSRQERQTGQAEIRKPGILAESTF